MKALQRIITTAQKIIGAELPTLEAIQRARCSKDQTHPDHCFFTLLLSGRQYRALYARNSRLRNSFYPPAVALKNSLHLIYLFTQL